MIQKLQPNLENTITVKFELCTRGYYALPDFTTLFLVLAKISEE
jgi:hypothetical protein